MGMYSNLIIAHDENSEIDGWNFLEVNSFYLP
jgi:hypothetical protein